MAKSRAWALILALATLTACGQSTKFASNNRRAPLGKPKVSDAQGKPGAAGSPEEQKAPDAEAAPLTNEAKTLRELKVSLDPERVNVMMTAQARAIAIYSDESSANVTEQVTWSLSPNNLADISNAQGSRGLITAKAAGTVKVKAKLGETSSGEAPLLIEAIGIKEINVTPDRREILVGAQTFFRAEAIFMDGSREDITAKAQWSLIPSGVATLEGVTAYGLPVVGKMPTQGDGAVLMAVYQGQSDSAQLVVKQVVTERLVLDPPSAEITVGGSKAFRALIQDSENKVTDVTALAQWQSMDTGKVTVAAGVAKGVAETGMTPAAIRATYNGKTADGTVLVRAKPVKELAVRPAEQTVLVNGQAQYRAYLVYDDGSEEEVTAAATWESASPAKAVVVDATPGAFKGVADSGDLGVTVIAKHPKAPAPANAKLVVNAPKVLDASLWLNETQGDIVVENAAQVRVRWQSVNATSCSVSPFGFATLTGDRVTGALATGTVSVKLSCQGPNNQTKDVSARIVVRPPRASLGIKANGTADAVSLPYDSNVTISWDFANATQCQVSGIGAVTAAGSRAEPHLLASRDYILACKDLEGVDVSAKVSVTIGNAPLPQVVLRANGAVGAPVVKQDTPVTLSWTVTTATSCTLTGPGVNVGINPANTAQYPVGTAADDRAFTMVCTGPGGQSSPSTVVVRTQRIVLLANGAAGKIVIAPNTGYSLTLASANVNTCTLEYDGVVEGIGPNARFDQGRQAGEWSRGYVFRCQGDAGEIATSVIVATLHMDVTLNGVPGQVAITKGQPVVVAYSAPEATNCYLDDTYTPAPNDRNVAVPSEAFLWGPIQEPGTRGLVIHCFNGGVHVAKGYPLVVNDLPPPPPPPFVVFAANSGENRDKVNRWDGNIKVCLFANGTVQVDTSPSLSAGDEIKDLHFTIYETNGITVRALPFAITYVGVATRTFQLPGNWAGVTRASPILAAKGRVSGGSVAPNVYNSPSPPNPPGCMTMLDGDKNQSGMAWSEINWNLAR